MENPPSPRSRTVHLKRGETEYEIAIHQANATNLKRMFKVSFIVQQSLLRNHCWGWYYGISSLHRWIQVMCGWWIHWGQLFFPEDNGYFNLENEPPFSTLVVQGPEFRTPPQSTAGTSSTITVNKAVSSSGPPVFKSVISKPGTHNVKVTIRC